MTEVVQPMGTLMRCDQTELLGPYVDGELPAAEADRVRRHVAACPDCAAEVEGLRAIGRMLLAAARPGGPAEPPPEVMDRLHLHLRDLVESADLTLIRMARVFSGLAASVLVGGLWLLMSHPSSTASVSPAAAPGDQFALVSLMTAPAANDGGLDGTGGRAAGASAAAGGVLAERSTRDTVFDRLLGVPEATAGGEVEVP